MLPLLLTESSQIFSLGNKRETKTGDSNDCSGGNSPQSKKTDVHSARAGNEQSVSLKGIPHHAILPSKSEADYNIMAYESGIKGASSKSLGIAVGTE